MPNIEYEILTGLWLESSARKYGIFSMTLVAEITKYLCYLATKVLTYYLPSAARRRVHIIVSKIGAI